MDRKLCIYAISCLPFIFTCRIIFSRRAAHYAAARGQLKVLQVLDANRVDLNKEDNKMETALHHAAYINRLGADGLHQEHMVTNHVLLIASNQTLWN